MKKKGSTVSMGNVEKYWKKRFHEIISKYMEKYAATRKIHSPTHKSIIDEIAKELDVSDKYLIQLITGSTKSIPSDVVIKKLYLTLEMTESDFLEVKYLAAAGRSPEIVLKKVKSLEDEIDILKKKISAQEAIKAIPNDILLKLSKLKDYDALNTFLNGTLTNL